MSALNISIFVTVAVAVVGWFAVGTQFNLHKGNKALEWLQEGLKLLGEKTSLRWLGSAAVELKIQDAKDPFRHAEVVVVLEPRDIPFTWLYYHLCGRRDLLIIRGQLRATPAFEFEALDPRAWSAHGIEKKLRFRNWSPLALSASSPLVAYTAGEALPASAELIEAASLDGCQPLRLAIRRTEPNFEIHWSLTEARKLSARTLLESTRRIPERVLTRD